jgi:hypothetical protein
MATKKTRKVRTVAVNDFTPLEIHAIQIHEYYLALRRAGFTVDAALYASTAGSSHPDWFVPNMPDHDPSNPNFTPYEDEDDD